MTCRWKKCLICRLRNYLRIEELSASQRTISRFICRLKNCLQIEDVFDLQIEEPSTDWRTIYRRKKYMTIKELSADRRSIRSVNRWSICRLIKYLQMEELFVDGTIVGRPKDYLIDRLQNDPQINFFSWIINLFLTLKFDSNKTVIDM